MDIMLSDVVRRATKARDEAIKEFGHCVTRWYEKAPQPGTVFFVTEAEYKTLMDELWRDSRIAHMEMEREKTLFGMTVKVIGNAPPGARK